MHTLNRPGKSKPSNHKKPTASHTRTILKKKSNLTPHYRSSRTTHSTAVPAAGETPTTATPISPTSPTSPLSHTSPVPSSTTKRQQHDPFTTSSHSSDILFNLPSNYPVISDVAIQLKRAWVANPSQIKSIQFPEWCLDKFIPTKAFTSLLDEIAHSPKGDLPLTKKCVTEVLIPLWNSYHEKLALGGPQFERVTDNIFSPSAVTAKDQGKLNYPQILHHHAPDILQITRRLFNLKTGEMNGVDLSIFETQTVTETQFKELYQSAVLVRYLHHQETLTQYIKSKFIELAEVALFPPNFGEQIRFEKKQMALDADLRNTVAAYTTDVDALNGITDFSETPIDITNPAIPIHIRYRYYMQKMPFFRDMVELGGMTLPVNHMELLSRCNLPSDPVLHSLHGIAKHLSKAQLLSDGGLLTVPLKQMLVDFGENMWSTLDLYMNPTEKKKENYYSNRGFFNLDQFYAQSLENHSTGGWKGKNDNIIPYPLTSVANPDKFLSEPLPWKTSLKYGMKYLYTTHKLNKLRTPFGSLTTSATVELRDPSTQYLKVLYTAKTVNQDQFGMGTDLEPHRAPKIPLMSRVSPEQSFTDAIPILVNPAISTKGQMIGLQHFSEDVRFLYENSPEFQDLVKRNFDQELRHVIAQLESAYHSIQRQNERYQYHSELHKAKQQFGELLPPVTPFSPDPTTLQRYNDQAYHLREITQDLEVVAQAWYQLVGAPKPEYTLYTGDLSTTERSHDDLTAELRLRVLKFAPRSTAIFLEKWLAEHAKPNNEENAEVAWDDFYEANRIFHKYDTTSQDRRRFVGAIYTEFMEGLLSGKKPQPMSPDTRTLTFGTNHPGSKLLKNELTIAQERAQEEEIEIELASPMWEGPDLLPLEFQTGPEQFPQQPSYASRPRGLKGNRRVISRNEFPTRDDLYQFYADIKPVALKYRESGALDEADRTKLVKLEEFFCMEELKQGF